MIYLMIIIWLYTGMYGYIFWVNKHNRRYRLKWHRDDVKMIPLFGLLGPVMFIVGYLMFNQEGK